MEMALAAARTFFDTPDAALENVEIRTPVVFQPQQAKLFRLVIEPRTATFTIETRDRMSDNAWTLNVTGRMLESGNALVNIPAGGSAQILMKVKARGGRKVHFQRTIRTTLMATSTVDPSKAANATVKLVLKAGTK